MANSAGNNIQAPTATKAFANKVGEQGVADELCAAACKAKKDKEKADKADKAKARKSKKKIKPSKNRNQSKMRQNIDPKKTRGSNQVGGDTGVLTEVGQVVKKGGMGDLIGKWGAATAKGLKYVKWDIILTVAKSTAKGTLTWGDIKKIVEVKFKNDVPTPNQDDAISKMGKKAREKFVIMDVEADCNCP